MYLRDIIEQNLVAGLQGPKVLGIDIGSRTGKAILIDGEQYFTAMIPTGIEIQETADELLDEILEKSGLQRSDIDYVVGTGYGRIALNFKDIPTRVVTEISCHSMGYHYLHPQTKTIIDIGGQDSKAIKVDTETGKVVEFVMNDKCAAGTGRFLERVANLLDLSIDELGTEAVKSKDPILISSQCVVFAESEAISLRAQGVARKDIAAGIHLATARRVCNQLKRIGLKPDLGFSGGVANNVGMKKAFEDLLGVPIAEVKLDTIFVGALGAAIYALDFYTTKMKTSKIQEDILFTLDLNDLEEQIIKRQEAIISGTEGKKKIGYLCTYTPPELITAAGADAVRLFKAGSTKEVASGEQITQSVFCDFTKSIIGAFKEEDSLYTALDKVYTFYTCDCIKIVSEAIRDFFIPADIFILPRLRHNEVSKDYYRDEILNYKQDLEKLVGREITTEEVRRQIKLYNQIRLTLQNISALRKRNNPPLTGRDYLELVKGYYYLPPEELLEMYQGIYDKLSAVPDKGEKKIRLMMSGGIVADGDRRLLELVEQDIGARIVVEDHCSGFRSIDFLIDEQEEAYQALANGYLKKEPCARMKPLQERVDLSGRLALDYQVDGILFVYLKFCPCYGQTKHEFFKHYQKLNLPILEIPIDYSKSDQGQLKTRLEAFIEVLRERESNTYAI
ncbi:MAG: acyl-CoA dehydratase activase [Syntrophomonadaceae bacterium]|nr:acyl-CoA dehydratase activase [Syntrophomonadaceae bacterium]